jgi:D-beta-D-heptose 7-phosphate kinase/D-beta-D-heptose 1-phosphate adenosyltransferase
MKTLVIGDIMLDINKFVWTERTAAEADIPVYNIDYTSYKLGGAANVCMNLANLKCDVRLLSIVGNDKEYNAIIKQLLDQNPDYISYDLYVEFDRCTTQKYRFFDMNSNKQVFRYDIENVNKIGEEICDYFYEKILEYLPDVIIFSDYEKSMLHPDLCSRIIKWANKHNVLTFVDPKVNNYIKYRNCFLFKPNMSEGQLISDRTSPEDICNFIHFSLNTNLVLLTNSGGGMYISHKNQRTYDNQYVCNTVEPSYITHIEQPVTDVVDVTGAGDIVLSTLVYAYCVLKKNMVDAVKMANFVAGKSVSTIGNYVVTLDDISEYETEYASSTVPRNLSVKVPQTRIITDYSLIGQIDSLGAPVVFTNGCFDIIHSAHLKLLNHAKTLGKTLVVGLNSDTSIQRIKGQQRPINKLEERIELLLQLNMIDYIIVFTEDTPYNILSKLKPDIIVKGGDYKPESIIGREFAKEVVIYDYIYGPSTTNTIKAVLDSNNK